MSTIQSPPPDAPLPEGPPERRCPRCGSTLAPEQEWCLACGAATGTEVVEARGWRVPLYLGGALVALAIIGVIIAIVALSDQKQEQPVGTPSPAASVPPGATVSPIPSSSAIPTIPATPTPSTPQPTPTETVSPEPTPTDTPDDSSSGT